VNDIEVSIRIDARPETVFRYFVDPERICTWMAVTADVDPRPGGRYCIDVNGRDVAMGEYVEVVADERVVWTFGWDGNDGIPPGSSTVEVTLTPDGDATVVRLRHSGLPDDSAAKNHRQGWDHYVARLALAAAGRDPGLDDWVTPK
jgi:uncharacterized protein YndB with AHSA1/START domain